MNIKAFEFQKQLGDENQDSYFRYMDVDMMA